MKRIGWGVGYALMAAFGVVGTYVAAGTVAALPAALLALIGAGGLAMVSFIRWFDRHRPAPVLAVAPSGAQGTFFSRSRFMIGFSVLCTLGLAGWTGALALVLYRLGHDVTAMLVTALTVLLLWPAAVAALGKVKPGGLWLTPFGLEHRQESTSWAVSWADLAAVERHPTQRMVPPPSSLGAAIQPVRLDLQAGGFPAIQRTTRWTWDREVREPGQEALVVDAYDLAGGPAMIAIAIEHYLAYPRLRGHLGTARSLPRLHTRSGRTNRPWAIRTACSRRRSPAPSRS
ncbi:MAG TPA: hypothetical protein VNA11_07250 [Pseudonocardia sp.]|nr:hypothetical protein [Pseudonocardia sp.]